MGLRYRKRVKVAPGVYLNLSKSGVSTTLKAGKGVSLSMGKNGTYLNTGIPGTGIYSRQKISSTGKQKKLSSSHFEKTQNMGYLCKKGKQSSNDNGSKKMGFWQKLWIILLIVSGVSFIIGIIVPNYLLVGLSVFGGTFFFLFLLTSLLIKHFKQKRNAKKSKKNIPVEVAKEDVMAKNESGKDNETSQKDNIIKEELCKPVITKEMVEKLLAPFEPIHIPIPEGADPLYLQAWQLVVEQRKATIVMLQRQFQIGNVRAGRILNQLETSGIVGRANGSQPREVYRIWERPWENVNPTDEQLICALKIVLSKQSISWHTIMRAYWDYMPVGQRSINSYTEKKIIERLLSTGIITNGTNGGFPVTVRDDGTLELILKEKHSAFKKYDEILLVADELFALCQQLNEDAVFLDELSKHNLQVNGSDGKPMFGDNGKTRSLFFLDIAHCYLEMADIIDLKRDDGIGVLYLMFRLFEPATPVPHDRQHIDVIKSTLPSGAESIIHQMRDKPFFHDGDIDFTVAAILKRYNKDLLNKYLTLLFRYCSLIAKADGNITDKEQRFLDHIAQLRTNSMNGHEGVTIQKTSTEKKEGMVELDGLIGLASVKQEVRTMSNFIKVQLSRQQQGLKTTQVSYHCVFTGNPGTGKTTVARILAGIYNELGVLKKGHLVETDRSGLVAEYVGQTAVKTNKVIDSALDGVLFIDEAYSLVTGSGNDYGNEAIATLLKRMEDDRERLIVILAGYGDEMKQFIDSNPGLQSRFNRYIHFPDYNAEELLQIFSRYAQKNDYEVTPEAQEKLKSLLENTVKNKDKNFGNGRFVRNLFEKTLEQQANRLSTIERPTLSQLKEIIPEDIL